MKDTTIAIGVGVVVVLFMFGISRLFSSSSSSTMNKDQGAAASGAQTENTGNTGAANENATAFADPAGTPAASQVKRQDIVVGKGALVAPGDTIAVNYTGKLKNGTVFDTSIGKEPIVFAYGQEGFIGGWNAGFIGMKEGGKRVITIPAALGYGAQQVGIIPPNSDLVFEVELVKVEKPDAVN